MSNMNGWHRCGTAHFWGEIAPGDHVVQIYDNDKMLLNTLADYVSDGFNVGDSVIIIATAVHNAELNKMLLFRGFSLDTLISEGQYIVLDALHTLAKFMVNGYPDEKYFMETVNRVMKKAQARGIKVRAFGEMVALLWERGSRAATIQLEQLWNKFCEKEAFCLFCAYPKSGFKNDAGASIMHICTAHTKVIGSDENFPLEIQYKNVV